MQYHQGSIEPSDQWKNKYKHQQQQSQQHRESPQQQQPQQPPAPLQQSGGKGYARHIDDRHIIRMAQPPSPLSKPPFHEPASSPDSHFYQNSRSGPPQPQPPSAQQQQVSPQNSHPSNQSHQFNLDCYLKKRIVEEMRNEDVDDGGQSSMSVHEQRRNPPPHHHQPHPHHGPHSGHHSMHHKDIDRSSTPGDMVIDEDVSISSSAPDHRPPSGGHLQQQRFESQHPPSPHMHNNPVTTFAPTSYPYPFSALNVSGTQVVAQLSQLEEAQKRNHQQHQPHNSMSLVSAQQQAEPKPLLSAQYEGISDED